jgi:hypothetical protein
VLIITEIKLRRKIIKASYGSFLHGQPAAIQFLDFSYPGIYAKIAHLLFIRVLKICAIKYYRLSGNFKAIP